MAISSRHKLFLYYAHSPLGQLNRKKILNWGNMISLQTVFPCPSQCTIGNEITTVILFLCIWNISCWVGRIRTFLSFLSYWQKVSFKFYKTDVHKLPALSATTLDVNWAPSGMVSLRIRVESKWTYFKDLSINPQHNFWIAALSTKVSTVSAYRERSLVDGMDS